ncbi:MAG: MmcQ/YjbR family DNA-binding protein [Acidimicrobiia bacterium]
MTGRLDYEEVLARCLAYPGAWKDQPWGDEVVTKVDEKIFAFLGADSVGVKCGDSREEADVWLSRYPDDVRVMSYIGRHGWNVITVGGAVPDGEVLDAIEDSYLIVVSKLPKKKRPDGWDQL